MTVRTLQNDDNNRDEGIEKTQLVALRTIWLASEDLTQTPRENLISDLLDRYSSVRDVLLLFRNFEFIPKKPVRVLVL